MAGQLVHFEFPVKDADKGEQFFSSLFGWKFSRPDMGGFDYRMVQTAEQQGGAVYPVQGDESGPIIYFDTDDIDASLARVRELGGEAEDKQPIPSIGWFARCKDPDGNAFSLYQSDESAAPH